MTARPPRVLPRTTLSATELEDRTVPAFWGTPWPAADGLTISFPKDGTPFATGGSSYLFQNTLGGAGTAAWQREVLRAYQTWLGPVNVNVGVVADDGSPLGAPGPLQGSAARGDIRVAGRVMPAGSSLATATPFDLLGSGAGDILVNSGVTYSVGGANGAYDIYTVALHEAGHTLGLEDSGDPASAMYGTYAGPRSGPSDADRAQLGAIYGARAPDRFEASPGGVAPLTFAKGVDALLKAGRDDPANDGTPGVVLTLGAAPVVAAGSLDSASDRDVFSVAKPADADKLAVNLRTSGLSLLTARVTVYSPTGAVVQSAAATDALGGNLVLAIDKLPKVAGTYTVAVEANAGTPFTAGRYRLAVGPDAAKAVFPAPVAGLVNPDAGTDDTAAAAGLMPGQGAAGTGRWGGSYRASVEKNTDRDFYRVDVPAGSAADTLVAVVWATESNRLDPTLRAYDSNGTRLAFDILSADASSFTLQLRGVAPGRGYFVEVAAQNPADAKTSVGNYVVAVDLRGGALQLPTLASGALDSAAKEVSYSLTAEAGRLYYFQLNATGSATDVAVRATVYDSAGRAVGSFGAYAGGQAAIELRLAGGEYTVRVTSGKKSGGAYTADFALGGALRDDPLGPVAVSPGSTGSTTVRISVVRVAATAVVLPAYQDPWFGL